MSASLPRGSVARRLDAGFALLDRQVVDREGHLAGKVDDLLFEVPEEGGSPYVVALLSGAGNLATRLGGRLGRLAAALSHRVRVQPELEGRLPIEAVTDIGDHVTISLERHELDSDATERIVRDGIVAKIPGSGHAPE
jgi:hypothetical protein